MWRLGRCGEVEQSFVTDHVESDNAATSIPDPMRHETQAKLQLSVDRARALYQRLLHKCTAELRKLQTERQLRNESFQAGTDLSDFGLCDWAFISKDLARQFMRGRLPRRDKYAAPMAGNRRHPPHLVRPLRSARFVCKTNANAYVPAKHKPLL